MAKFEMIRAELIQDNNARMAENRGFIANGTESETDRGIRFYSTETRWTQYQKGVITREKAVEYATTRMEKQQAKELAKKLKWLEMVEDAPDVTDISISVDWVRSSTWGHNPHAEIDDGYARYSGRASGCGYDKESAAVAEALNRSPHIIKALCEAKEAALKAGASDYSATACTGHDNREILGYGAGYGAIPAFEGGVGMSSFMNIFRSLGFDVTCNSGKTYNCYGFYRDIAGKAAKEEAMQADKAA